MNRLRGKKKNKDEAFSARPSMDTESSGPFRMFTKKKSQEEEPKKEVDLTAALPKSDDFRTSLLMTGLSARFSMLREQDDPHSKLGKASDDSVLFPKRHSRLGDYGLGAALPDITEIESIKARPFARVDSFVSSDDAASTNGSIMNRGKPSDGNNLFGGRQKIYKIPVGSTAKGGGMGGRALYDDDVAQSAFQRWRQAERERHSLDRDRKDEPADADLDYSRRRETSSTTSSAAARNSTAATSVASSQPASVKDWPANQSSTTLERSVTRTRRLYEQGLSQDLHEQQSSALSRMDTLSRARRLGSRTPEPAPLVPSPTGMAFGERPQERRPIVSKASAPNLRSFSPPTASSTYMMSPPEPNGKFSKSDPKPNYGGNPPLSPPISEAEDYPALPIQPNDRGKATAMGVFQRPAQQYDESKYAQRQRQLQQGREVPPESNLLGGTFRSASSSSSSRRSPSEKTTASVEAAARKEKHNTTFFDDSDDASVDMRCSMPSITPQLTIDRPDDQDHPALRGPALPTPMSLSSLALSDETDSPADKAGEFSPDMPLDSPTLGPNSGLSGLVRQHLRHDSVASSISAATDRDSVALPSSGLGKSSRRREHPDKASALSDGLAGDQDDFARHLADGARRVRERLTTYVETDAPSTPLNASNKDEGALRPNGLGILRSKSSRSSLRDRDDQESGLSRLSKAQVPSSMSAGSSVSAHTSLASTRDDGRGSSERLAGKESPSMNKEDSTPAGLKAFRQARRELQKMKELETRQRFQKSTGEMDQMEGGAAHSLNRRPGDEPAKSNRSSECSRAASESRERSGSEASTVMTSLSRGARQRNGSVTYDEYQGPYGGGGLGRSSPSNGLTGLAGWDIRPSTGTGMSPSHSTGAIDGTGRRSGRSSSKAGSPNPQRHKMLHEGQQPYGQGRSGGLPSAAVSTPNLHATAASAPPLPPINPRRKNGGFGPTARPALEHASASHGSLSGGSEAYATAPTSEDEGFPKYRVGGRRLTAGDGGRAKATTSPPQLSTRTMVSQVNLTRGVLPGGMF